MTGRVKVDGFGLMVPIACIDVGILVNLIVKEMRTVVALGGMVILGTISNVEKNLVVTTAVQVVIHLTLSTAFVT